MEAYNAANDRFIKSQNYSDLPKESRVSMLRDGKTVAFWKDVMDEQTKRWRRQCQRFARFDAQRSRFIDIASALSRTDGDFVQTNNDGTLLAIVSYRYHEQQQRIVRGNATIYRVDQNDGSYSLWPVGRMLLGILDTPYINEVHFVASDTRLLLMARDFGGLYAVPAPGDMVLSHRAGMLKSLGLTPDGKMLVSASEGNTDGMIRFWDVASGRELKAVSANGARHVVAPDGQSVAWISSQKPLMLWRNDESTPLATTRPAKFGREKLAFSNDVKMLFTSFIGAKGWEVSAWDVATGKRTAIPDAPTDAGKLWIYSGRVFDAEYQLSRHWNARVSPDASVIAWPGERIDVTDAKSGQRRASLYGTGGADSPIAFSPDGKTLASGGRSVNGPEVNLWDMDLRLVRGRFPVGSPVVDVQFSADGRMLAAATQDGRIYVWHGKTKDE